MHIRERDTCYVDNQRGCNLVHCSGLLENQDDLRAAERIVVDLDRHPSQRVLEVGTRLGFVPFLIVRKASRQLVEAVGVDIVPEYIEIARIRARVAEAGDRLRYEVADMHELPFADEQFDYVFSQSVLEHAHDPQRVMGEVFRVASQRVVLEIDCANLSSSMRSHYTVKTAPQEWLRLVPSEFKVNSVYIADVLHVCATR